jgi:hypothetical protein
MPIGVRAIRARASPVRWNVASGLAHRRGGTQPKAFRTPVNGAVNVDDLDALALWMDSAFTIPGTRIRFGLDSLIGLLPGIGDAVSAVTSLYVLTRAHRAGVSRATIARMGVNVALDAAIGAVPIVGDLFDVYWKANRRNVDLLRQRLAAEPSDYRSLRRGDRAFVLVVWAILAAIVIGGVAATYYVVRALGGLFLS